MGSREREDRVFLCIHMLIHNLCKQYLFSRQKWVPNLNLFVMTFNEVLEVETTKMTFIVSESKMAAVGHIEFIRYQ